MVLSTLGDKDEENWSGKLSHTANAKTYMRAQPTDSWELEGLSESEVIASGAGGTRQARNKSSLFMPQTLSV